MYCKLTRLSLLWLGLCLCTLNVYAVHLPGDLAPRGAPDGQLNAGDLTILQRLLSGEIIPTSDEFIDADVAPLGAPDGALNGADLLILQRAILGQANLGVTGNSISFIGNVLGQQQEYGVQNAIPADFGAGEFTFQLWVKLDSSYDVGSTDESQGGDKSIYWSDSDIEPYTKDDWWWLGNFLLDGHNNFYPFTEGTFSIQIYGGGRVRWLFGDGGTQLLGMQANPASSTNDLLDDAWHQITLVRRWSGPSALLELWIDGAFVASEPSTLQTDMRFYWDNWTGYPSGQEGWFWGVEKGAAIGGFTYEDYKGLIDEARFWSYAMTGTEIATSFNQAISGTEPGLAGVYHFDEGTGTTTCDTVNPLQCINMQLLPPPGNWIIWDTENAPLN